MKARRKRKIRQWLAYLLVFCMTISCMEGIFTLGTWKVSAEETQDGQMPAGAKQEPEDHGAQLLDIVKDGHFTISIYTMDTFALVASSDQSLAAEVESIPVDDKLLVRFTDMYITKDVQDYEVYTMRLPASLVPCFDDEMLARDTWTELERSGYVKSYGKIWSSDEEDGSTAFYFSIYFAGTQHQTDILASFQYGAEIADGAPDEEDTVDADFPTDTLKIKVDFPDEDFTIKKTAVWKGTDSNVGDGSTSQLVYTVTIRNNRRDAGYAAVSTGYSNEGKEMLTDGLSYMSMTVSQDNYDDLLELWIDGEKCELRWQGPASLYYYDNEGRERACFILDNTGSTGSWVEYNAFKGDLLGIRLSSLVFRTLTFSYTVDTINVSDTGIATYQSDTVLNILEIGGEEYDAAKNPYTASATAVRTCIKPTVDVSVTSYNNTADAAAGENPVSTNGQISDRLGEVARYTARINPGGEDWVLLTEAPFALENGYSQHFYLSAYSLYRGSSRAYDEGQNWDVALLTDDGTEISCSRITASNILGVPVDETNFFSKNLEWEKIAAQYDIGSGAYVIGAYEYTDPADKGTKSVWLVALPETDQMAASSIQNIAGSSMGNPNTPLCADAENGDYAPGGYRLCALGLHGYTLELTYSKFMKKIPTAAHSVNGSILTAANSAGESEDYTYLDYQGEPLCSMEKTGTVLSDGAVMWDIEIDFTGLNQLMNGGMWEKFSGGIYGVNMSPKKLVDQLDERYTLSDDTRWYDSSGQFAGLTGDPAVDTNQCLQSGTLYALAEDGEHWYSNSAKQPDGKQFAYIPETQTWEASLDYFWATLWLYYSVQGGDDHTARLRYISTPTADGSPDASGTVRNRAQLDIYTMENSNGVPLVSVSDDARAVLPGLTNKTMGVDDGDASNILHSHITSQTFCADRNGVSYLNGVYSVHDDMKTTAAVYNTAGTTFADSTEKDTEAAKSIVLQKLAYRVRFADESEETLSGTFDFSAEGTESADGSSLIFTDGQAKLTVSKDRNMYDGFSLMVSGLERAAQVEIDYWTAFDYAAYQEAHPDAKKVQLNYQNAFARDYELLPNDHAKLTASHGGFSMAVKPDLTKAWDEETGLLEDGYANNYIIEADVGAKALSGVYLVDQITGIRNWIDDGTVLGREEAITGDDLAALVALYSAQDIRITLKNRLDNSVSEEVFRLNADGTWEINTEAGWDVRDAGDEDVLADVPVTGDAKELNGNIFAYYISNENGIPANSYFEITYTLRLDSTRVDGSTAFRHLDSYAGERLKVDNQAAICYRLSDVAGSASVFRAYSAAARDVSETWVAAGAAVENVAYLTYSYASKVGNEVESSADGKTSWKIFANTGSAGKSEYPLDGQLTDELRLTTGFAEDDELNEKLLELLAEHTTVTITDIAAASEGVQSTLAVGQTAALSELTPAPVYVHSYTDSDDVFHEGYLMAELFTVSGFDYSDQVTAYYTTQTDWEGFYAAVKNAVAAGELPDTITDDILVKQLKPSVLNMIHDMENTVVKKEWDYPTQLEAAIGKSVVSADSESGIIKWDIHATLDGSDISGYEITDTIEPAENDRNGQALLRLTSLYSFSVVRGQETVYTYTGAFPDEGETLELPAVEGLWDSARLTLGKKYADAGAFSNQLFSIVFEPLKDGADFHIVYETKLELEWWGSTITSTGVFTLGQAQSIVNSVAAIGDEVSLHGTATGTLTPKAPTITKQPDHEHTRANETAWTVTATTGGISQGLFYIYDKISSPVLSADMYHLKYLRILLTENGETRVLGELENVDGMEYEQIFEDHWYFHYSTWGGAVTLYLDYSVSQDGPPLAANSVVTMEYIYEIDEEKYDAWYEETFGGQTNPNYPTKGCVEIINEAELFEAYHGKEYTGSKTDIIHLTDTLTKTGDVHYAQGDEMSSIDWTVDVHLLNNYTKEELAGLKEVTLMDVLPEELKLVGGSVKLYALNAQDDGYEAGAKLTSGVSVQENEGNSFSVKLDWTSAAVNRYTDFRLVYSTAPTRELETVSNNVTLLIDGKAVEETTETTTDRVFLKEQRGTVASRTAPITYSLEAGKLFDGETAKQEFEFRAVEVDEDGAILYQTDGDGAETETPVYLSEKTNDTDSISETFGRIIFDPIVYDSEGTHYYQVREVLPEDGNAVSGDGTIRYDESVYTLKVEVAVDENTGGYAVQTSIFKVERDGAEVEASGLTYEDLAFYNTALTTCTVQKVWDDSDNQDGIRPESIQVQLLADGEAYGAPVTLTGGDWTYTWTQLPLKKNTDGVYTEIDYTVQEVSTPEGYDTPAYSTDETSGQLIITNSHTPETVARTVTKVWDDDDDRDRVRPDSVKVYLYADNQTEAVREAELSADNGWTVEWTDLPKYADGVEINYSVLEDQTDPYTFSIQEEISPDDSSLTEVTITNSYTPEKTAVSGRKIWDDANDQDGVRPERITVNLCVNDEVIDSKEVTADDNWAWTFENLNKYEGGEPIHYTITEETVEGYTTDIRKTDAGWEIVNTHEPEKTVVSGSKTWDDAENQDGIRPERITVNLCVNDKVIDSKDVTADDNWAWTFENLDKYAGGAEIIYTVTETPVEGYTTEYAQTGNTWLITNTHEIEKTSVSITKVWDDAENQDGIRSERITINLYADGELADSREVTADDNWAWTFDNLDRYAGGAEIIYTVTETPIEGYTTAYVQTGNTWEITNTHETEKISVSITKVWDDAENQDGIRPERITVNLYADGELADSREVTEADGWTWTFENLDKYAGGAEIIYTVTETPVEGYTTEYAQTGNTWEITNTHETEKTSVSITKVWDDAENQDDIRPERITVNLYADGELADSREVTEADNWAWTFENLDRYAGGAEIIYTVTETPVEGYTTEYAQTGNTWEITNTHETEKTSVGITKVWDDAKNQDGIRPERITVNLYADGELADSREVTEADGWTWTFENLDRYAGGAEIIYTVTETPVEGYTTEYAQTGNTWEITNTHETEKTSVSITKVWDDAENQDGIRPERITVNLYADGVLIKSVEVTEADQWSWSFDNLDKYTSGEKNAKFTEVSYGFADLVRYAGGGIEIRYTVTETPVEGYTTEYAQTGNTWLITNTHETEKTSISITKVWDDADNQDGIRPERITVNLYADGELADSREVTEADGWTWTFENLDRYAGGAEIIYTVTETPIEGYTAEYIQVGSSWSIINRHEAEDKSTQESTQETESSEETESSDETETTQESEETTSETESASESESTAETETETEASTESSSTAETPSDGGNLGEDGSGHLPITGMVIAPITVLSILGILLVLAGLTDNKRRQNRGR